MEYLVNNTHIAAKFPACGRTLLFNDHPRTKSAYLYFPEHLFVMPRYIDNCGNLRIKETRGISLFFKNKDKLCIPHIPDIDGSGGICTSNNHGIISAPPVDAINLAINQFFSNISRFPVHTSYLSFQTWIRESKQNKCPLHLFECYPFHDTLEPISLQKLKELK